MLKLLFATSLLLAPAIYGANNNVYQQKNELLHVNYDIRSEKSDEFLTYWKEDFRKDDKGQIIPICDITYNSYIEMYGKYADLVESDRNVINATADYEAGYTIKDSIVELVRIHGGKKLNPSQERRTLDQSSTITLIVVIAVFGMSVICIFFVMKNNNIIQ